MNANRKKIIIGVVTAVVIIAAIIGWCVWRQHVTRQDAQQQTTVNHGKTTEPQAQSSSSAKQETSKPDSSRTAIAERFEHVTRDWGVDPAKVMDTANAYKPTMDVLTPLRTPAEMPIPSAMNEVSVIQRDPERGADAPSAYCAMGRGGMCGLSNTGYDYWRAVAWTMGARVQDMKSVLNDDGTVTVTGKVRVVLWSNPTGALTLIAGNGQQWWGFSPKSGYVSFRDKLTFNNDNKVSARDTHVSTVTWLADPWFCSWDFDAAAHTDSWEDAQQINIPLKGERPDLFGVEGLVRDGNRYMENMVETGDYRDLWKKIPEQNTYLDLYPDDMPPQCSAPDPLNMPKECLEWDEQHRQN